MFSISTYFSLSYLVLLLGTILLYAVIPGKGRRWVLLLSGWLFFYAVSGKLLIYLLLSILSIHHTGIWLELVQKEGSEAAKGADRMQRKAISAEYRGKQKKILLFAVSLHIGLLLVLKYTPFAVININRLLRLTGIGLPLKIPAFLLPIGISFYTLQAVSYLSDVYLKKIPADRNLLRLALYMSFFPQIMEGPICRYSDTAEALWRADKLRFQNFIFGCQRILFGLMKKLVLADRLNLLIKNVFLQYTDYDGFVIAVSVACYTLQLYMDFSGTMDLVLGSAEIFGIGLPENFRRPFFSRSVTEFWMRWHITLGSWFKDYLFYPVSMSPFIKKLTLRARKKMGNLYGPMLTGSIALLLVWLCNGLWHGAGWHFIVFGLYHFVLILSENAVEPLALRLTEKLHISRTGLFYSSFRILRTTVLVCIGELFFRAENLRWGFGMFLKIFTDFTFTSVKDGRLFSYGMDRADYVIIGISMIILLIVSLLREKGIPIRKTIAGKHLAVQFAIYYALIMYIIIFGAYGPGYVPLDPIYAAF